MPPLLRSTVWLWLPIALTQALFFVSVRARGGAAFAPLLLLSAAWLGRVQGGRLTAAGHERANVPLGLFGLIGAVAGFLLAYWTENALLDWAHARYSQREAPAAIDWLVYRGVTQTAVFWLAVAAAEYVVLRHLGPRAPAWIPALLTIGLLGDLGFVLWSHGYPLTIARAAGAFAAFTAAAFLMAGAIGWLFPHRIDVTPDQDAARAAA